MHLGTIPLIPILSIEVIPVFLLKKTLFMGLESRILHWNTALLTLEIHYLNFGEFSRDRRDNHVVVPQDDSVPQAHLRVVPRTGLVRIAPVVAFGRE